MDLKELGQLIKKIRIEKKMTQEELSKLSGYSNRSAITRIEKGQIDLPESKISSIAKALGVTTYYLMGWEKENKNLLYGEYDLSDLSEKERIELDVIISNAYGLFMSREKTLSDHDKEELKRILVKAYFSNRKK